MKTMRLAALVGAFIVTVSPADEQVVGLVKKVKPSVVRLHSNLGRSGTGFVVGQDLIATNYHVVEDSRAVTVVFFDKSTVPSSGVMYLDPDRDLALIQAKVPDGVQPIAIHDRMPEVGEDVVTIGHSEGFEYSVSEGIVSGRRTGSQMNPKRAGSWVQTTAPISPGNSGGPLLLKGTGAVVGINSFIYLGEDHVAQNLNFAISCIDLRQAIDAAKSAELTKFSDLFSQPRTGRPSPDPPSSGQSSDDVWASLRQAIFDELSTVIPRLSPSQLSTLQYGSIVNVFPPAKLEEIREGRVIRLQAQTTVIQVEESWILVGIGKSTFKVLLPAGGGGALRAKVGDDVIPGIPLDAVYYVGKAQSYTTVTNATSCGLEL